MLFLLTPTATGTALGAWWWLHGLTVHAGASFVSVGFGGIGGAFILTVKSMGKPWWWPSVVEATWQILTGRAWGALAGILTHAPQAAIGLWLLT